jgi:hypothetical protein
MPQSKNKSAIAIEVVSRMRVFKTSWDAVIIKCNPTSRGAFLILPGVVFSECAHLFLMDEWLPGFNDRWAAFPQYLQ